MLTNLNRLLAVLPILERGRPIWTGPAPPLSHIPHTISTALWIARVRQFCATFVPRLRTPCHVYTTFVPRSASWRAELNGLPDARRYILDINAFLL